MVLELHIWGPAFSLPSIDPQCLAVVAYCTQAVPKGEWVLVASNDEGLSATRHLPVLRDGTNVVSGYQSIVAHLRRISNGEWDLDASLDPLQRADCIAFTSFLDSHALPLVDLSLYVSTQNYSAATRGAYSQFLPFPDTWIHPPKRRAVAKVRTGHLGSSSLDLEGTNNDTQPEDASPLSRAAEQIPQSLRRGKRASVLESHATAQIRLAGHADTLFAPLKRLLALKSYLLSSNHLSSLDCLALGYLALALLPDVPHPWLSNSLKKDYPSLTSYVTRMVEKCYGGNVQREDAFPNDKIVTEDGEDPFSSYDNMSIGSGKVTLPWQKPSPRSALATTSLVIEHTLGEILYVGQLSRKDTPSPQSDSEGKSAFVPIALTLGTGLVALVSWLFYSDTLGIYTSDPALERRRLQDMGEAGAMLSWMDSDPRPVGVRNDTIPVVETMVTVEDGSGVEVT